MKVRVYIHSDVAAFWTQVTLGGIAAEIARKRYDVEYIQGKPIDGIDLDALFAPDERRLLIYLGNSATRLAEDLQHLAEHGVHVILVNHETDLLSGNCSKVLFDYRGGMQRSISYLCANGHDRIALFGINPSSSTDLLKKNYFEAYLSQKGGDSARDIYFNYASAEDCIARFVQNLALYNAVICANDLLALELIRSLTERGIRVPEDLYVTSCGGSSLVTETARIPVTSVFSDQYEVGRQAVLAYSTLAKNPCDVSLTFLVKARLTVRASTAYAPDPGTSFSYTYVPDRQDFNFYIDPPMQRLLRIETLLMSFDDLDRDILDGILAGESYPTIAERRYTSENVVAYRVKRMCRIAECKNRIELLALLQPYLEVMRSAHPPAERKEDT